MRSLVTIGLKQLRIAPLAADGGPGTVFVDINVSKGTFTISEEDPTTKKVEIEQSSDPLKSYKRAGAKTITFSIPDPDTDMLALMRGGTVGTVGQVKTYSEDTPVSYQCTIQVVPEEGFDSIQYNSVDLFAKLDGQLGSEQEALLVATADILKPTKAGVKVWEAIETLPAA